MCLWCCSKDVDEQDLMNLFDKIWIQKVGDIDLKVISAVENSNKFQKPGFGRKNQLGCGNTGANGTCHTG
jgi:hypothetical protein